MPKLKLTDAAVRRIKPPVSGQVDYWDSLLPAFGLRVSYNGAKAWVVTLRILQNGEWKQTRVTLGRYPDTNLATARQKARDAKMAAQAGKDPRTIKEDTRRALEANSRNTFAGARQRFFDQYQVESKCKASTFAEYKRCLSLDLFKPWENRPVRDISDTDVMAATDSFLATGKPIMANRMFATLRIFFRWAKKKKIITTDPTADLEMPVTETPRERNLSNIDIPPVWRAFDAAGPYAPLFRLLLVTGQRESEVAGMRRSELRDLEGAQPLWEIAGSRTKNGKPHCVPLSPLAVHLIKSVSGEHDLIFCSECDTPLSCFSRAKRQVDDRLAVIIKERESASIAPWRLHDLRRTSATRMGDLGIATDVIELVLNHSSGTRGGIAGVYNRSERMNERRQALELWAAHIERLTTAASNVVHLGARAA